MSGFELHHTDQSNGTPALLFVHGFSSGSEDWEPLVNHLSARHRIIAPDLRGHGKSPRGKAEMTIQQLAADCLDLVRNAGIKSLVVGGHSMGTRVALEIGRQAPEIVIGLVLVDGSNTALAGKEASLQSFDKTVSEEGYASFARRLFEAMFFDPQHEALSRQLVDRALSLPEETVRTLYRNMVIWDADEANAVMKNTTAPVLVIQSTTRGPDQARRTLEPGETGAYETVIKENIPHAKIVGLPGFGHFITLEAPKQVNAAIDAWLDSNHLRG